MFIMFCSASSPEQLKAARHIIHCRYFLLDVKQYPSHRTSSIQLAEHICTFFAQNVSFSRCAVCRCEGRVVAQWPSAAPDLLTQLSTAEARSHGHSSQRHS